MLDMVELSMGKGRDFKDLRVTKFKHPLGQSKVNEDIREKTSIRFYAKIVGYIREGYDYEYKGIRSIEEYRPPKPKIVYKTKYKYRSQIKKPKTPFERVMATLGFYRRVE